MCFVLVCLFYFLQKDTFSKGLICVLIIGLRVLFKLLQNKNTHFLKPDISFHNSQNTTYFYKHMFVFLMSYGVFVTTYTLAEGTLLPRTETLFALGAIVITKTHGSPISNNHVFFDCASPPSKKNNNHKKKRKTTADCCRFVVRITSRAAVARDANSTLKICLVSCWDVAV